MFLFEKIYIILYYLLELDNRSKSSVSENFLFLDPSIRVHLYIESDDISETFQRRPFHIKPYPTEIFVDPSLFELFTLFLNDSRFLCDVSLSSSTYLVN